MTTQRPLQNVRRAAFPGLHRPAIRFTSVLLAGLTSLATLETTARASDRTAVRDLVRPPISRTSNTVGELPSLRYDAPSLRFPVDPRARYVDNGASSAVLSPAQPAARGTARAAFRDRAERPAPTIVLNYGTINSIGVVAPAASSSAFVVAPGVGTLTCPGGVCGLSSASVLAEAAAFRTPSSSLATVARIDAAFADDRYRRADTRGLDFGLSDPRQGRWHDWYDGRWPRYRYYYHPHTDRRGHDCWPWNDRGWWSHRRRASSADTLIEAQWLRMAQSEADFLSVAQTTHAPDPALAQSFVRAIVDRSSRGDYAGALASALKAGDAAGSAQALLALNLHRQDPTFSQRAGWTLRVLRNPASDAAHRREALAAAAVLGAALGEPQHALADASRALAAGDRSPLIAGLAAAAAHHGNAPAVAAVSPP